MPETTRGEVILQPCAKFIDLSYANQVTDWDKVREQVDFIMLRCGFRGYTKGGLREDSNFEEYAKECRGKIPFGLYYMSQAINEAEAIEEAKYCVNTYHKSGATLPIFIDCEASNSKKNGRADQLSKAKRTEIAKAFCDYVQKCGIQSGVYASTNWYKNHLNLEELLKERNYLIWWASYGSNSGKPSTELPGEILDFWQYTSQGRVTGVGPLNVNWNQYKTEEEKEKIKRKLNVDMNYSYLTIPQLQEMSKVNTKQMLEQVKQAISECFEGDKSACISYKELLKCLWYIYYKKTERQRN